MRSCAKELPGQKEVILFSRIGFSEGHPPDFEQTSACLSLNLVYILLVRETEDDE